MAETIRQRIARIVLERYLETGEPVKHEEVYERLGDSDESVTFSGTEIMWYDPPGRPGHQGMVPTPEAFRKALLLASTVAH